MTDLELGRQLYNCLKAVLTRTQTGHSPTPAEERDAIDVIQEADRTWGEPLEYPPEPTPPPVLSLAGRRVLDSNGVVVGSIDRNSRMFVFQPTLSGLRLGYQANWATTANRLLRLVQKT